MHAHKNKTKAIPKGGKLNLESEVNSNFMISLGSKIFEVGRADDT